MSSRAGRRVEHAQPSLVSLRVPPGFRTSDYIPRKGRYSAASDTRPYSGAYFLLTVLTHAAGGASGFAFSVASASQSARNWTERGRGQDVNRMPGPPDAEERRQSERGSCEPDDGAAEMGFRPGLGGSFGSLSSLQCALEDDGATTVDDASSTQHAVRAGEAFATWEGRHAEGLSRRPTREAALPDGVARKPTGMPGDAVQRHAAHQAWKDRCVGR